MNFLSTLFDRIICLVCALTLMQAPIFISQYSNTLNGALSESRILYVDLEQRANLHGLSVKDYLKRHLEAEELMFRESGLVLERATERYRHHVLTAQQLHSAPVWQRPLVLSYNFDPEIARAMQFEAGIPFTLEGLTYALLGLLLGITLSRLVRALTPRRLRLGARH